jgi:hypothetical protein
MTSCNAAKPVALGKSNEGSIIKQHLGPDIQDNTNPFIAPTRHSSND